MTVASVRRGPIASAEGLVEIDGQDFYCVPDLDRLAPFLMSVVSDGDRWMFLSSTGGLTAGRGDARGALFPYETDDRIHRNAGVNGAVTAIRDLSSGELWTPFRGSPPAGATRSLYKSVVGDSVLFEEVHTRLGIEFRYRWASCDRFGFVRTASIANGGDRPVLLSLADGLLGILPFGLDPAVYQRMSNLTNAYKRSEVVDDGAGRLAVYSLESRVADRPEPEEVLRASAVWSTGLPDAELTLHPDALGDVESGRPPTPGRLVTGLPAGYLLMAELEMAPGEASDWRIVADVAQDHRDLAKLRIDLRGSQGIDDEIGEALQSARSSLVEVMAPADALQCTGDPVATAHQFSNVTYNVMRGGVPLDGYRLSTDDFIAFVGERNRRIARAHRTWLEALPDTMDRRDLLEGVEALGDPHLQRLALEYLPFSFSRRHGDPSRPWNAFSIRVRDAGGRPIVYYEGNWRDIFQNWEALSTSFPAYLPGMISVFVGASTVDGFNPYRITRQGIDWEIPDPDDPWSNIGYWGDHQVIYLLRLLEASDRFLPGWVEGALDRRWFSYADVPYRLADYDRLVEDPKSTITYDVSTAARAASRVEEIGGDGRLLWTDEGEVYLAPLLEKLIVPALSKLANFVPGGGIWMNTQRPEWNDANNALVGYGLSMVTLYHVRRYLDHLRSLLLGSGDRTVDVSTEVGEWLGAIHEVLRSRSPEEALADDASRKRMLDQLGSVFTEYRTRTAGGFTGVTPLRFGAVVAMIEIALEHLDETIRRGRRDDGLFHAYNLIRFGEDRSTAAVEHLGVMLEGQVAVLDSGVLTPGDRVALIEALFESDLYREDQRSFMLYPAHRPLPFLEKNVIPRDTIDANPLFTALIAEGDDSLVLVDAEGRHRFSADFENLDDVEAALDRLADDGRWVDLVRECRKPTLDAYEAVFMHHAYTGRSGSMYGYEGLGSIYWHMVAKLLVAVQESVVDAASRRAADSTVERLSAAYWRIRSGLGFNKTAREFGAIPIDPYSHTPAHAGAQQPGMTGSVKEELLTRPLELGVRVEGGEIRFDSMLLRNDELLTGPQSWEVYDVAMSPVDIELERGSLGFTVCQVPVVVRPTAGDPEIEILRRDGSRGSISGTHIDAVTSAEIFGRTGEVAAIRVSLPMTR